MKNRYFLISNYTKFSNKYFDKFEIIKDFEFDINFDEFSKTVFYDIETNGLDCHINKPLLLGLIMHHKETKELYNIAIHHNYCDKSFLDNLFYNLKDFKFVGHNIKFDIKFTYTNHNVLIENVYDTMIAEQRLYQKSGIRMGYSEVVERYTGVRLSKDTRQGFVGRNYKSFIPTIQELDYLFNDTKYLKNIKDSQYQVIYNEDLYNLIEKIENPLVSIIAKIEADGSDFNLKRWKQLATQAFDERFEYELEMDKILNNLRDRLYKEEKISELNYLRLKDPKLVKLRKKSELYNHFSHLGKPLGKDLFGNPLTNKQFTGVKKKVDFYKNSYNYNSDDLIVKIFAMLEQPCPTKYSGPVVPEFLNNGRIDKSTYSFTTKSDFIESYLIDNSDSILKEFLNLLLKHRSKATLINSFGFKYEDKINPITKNIHTVFRQARADTGRLQSGGGRKEPDKINFQNIPAIADYRNCFIARENSDIYTSDYSGAELVIMCSLSGDMDLFNISQKDMHSYIATKCWRAIYNHRLNIYQNMLEKGSSYYTVKQLQDKVDKFYYLINNFEVNKNTEEGKLIRTSFKPVTFGVIYGLTYYNLAEQLNITEEEAKIVIDTIETSFPKVFKFVKSCSKFAKENGYITISNRTKSRVYFPTIISYLNKEISFRDNAKQIFKEANEARNAPIQGTQADFMKEAIVNIWKVWKKFNIDGKFMTFVHDEIVDDIPKSERNRTYKLHNKTFNGYKELKEYVMETTANSYLSKVKIKVETDVKPYWTK